MMMVTIILMLQIVSIKTPDAEDANIKARKARTSQAVPDVSLTPSSTIADPVTVPSSEMPMPAQVLLRGKAMSDAADQRKQRSIIPQPTILGCKVTSSNPAGVSRISDGLLNGRVTFAQCDGFVAVISDNDMSKATSPSMSVYKKDSGPKALLNGGYRYSDYRRAADGRNELVLNWFSEKASRMVSIDIYPDTMTARQATYAGYRILDALTAMSPR